MYDNIFHYISIFRTFFLLSHELYLVMILHIHSETDFSKL